MSLCCKTKINALPMYGVRDKDMMKFEILPHSSVANSGHAPKGNLVGVIPIHSLQVESIFTVAHSEEKVKSNSLSQIGR